MRQDKAAKDKEEKEATRALEQIEAVSKLVIILIYNILAWLMITSKIFMLVNIKCEQVTIS